MVANIDPFNDEAFVRKFEERRREHDSVNLTVDEPAILSRVKMLNPSSVLEVGCATGALTRRLTEHTSRLVALDRSELMIAKASANLKSDKVTFVCSDFSDFTQVAKFDLVVSAMAAHLVEDFESFVLAAYNSLQVGGRFIFTQRHPFRTANPTGCAQPDGPPSWQVSEYFQQGRREYLWLNTEVCCYHRSIEEIVSILTKIGFSIVDLAEPQPDTTIVSERVTENFSSPSVLLLDVMRC